MATNDQSNSGQVPQPRRSTLSAEYQRDWTEYYSAVAGKPPRDTLLKAADLFDQGQNQNQDQNQSPGGAATASRHAIDIGCGVGRDSHELLRRGWRVWATDFNDDSQRHTLGAAPPGTSGRLAYVASAMEDLPANPQLPRVADLINASFALPFCNPEKFADLWRWIERTVRPGGRFAGQFFGDRDEWACIRPKSHFTRAQVEELFHGWAFEHFEEVEKEGDDAMGNTKYHHVFHIVARRDTGAEHA